MKKGRILVLLSAALMVLTPIADRNEASSQVVVDKWEVPFINTWTGVGAGYGVLCDFFQKAAMEEINASGGIAGKPLVMQDLDTAMDPTRAASCMKKAVEKGLVTSVQ